VLRKTRLQSLIFICPAVSGLWLCGCDEKIPRTHFKVISGTVVACHADTGELRVRAQTPPASADETIYCVVTRDAEIYVNDRFSSINEIQLGDGVELVGYHDPEEQANRFVVSFANIDHPSSSAPAPVLAPAPAATQETLDTIEPRED